MFCSFPTLDAHLDCAPCGMTRLGCNTALEHELRFVTLFSKLSGQKTAVQGKRPFHASKDIS